MSALDYYIKKALAKEEEWIEFLATYSDKRLQKNCVLTAYSKYMQANKKTKRAGSIYAYWKI